MTLPLLLSVPHAGLEVPPEVRAASLLTPDEIAADGDGGAAEIYRPLEPEVAVLVTTEVGRPFVDMNRAEDDIRKDGVVKTHTCWDVPIYREPLGPEVVEALLERYHRPYHRRLTREASSGVVAGVDCHTMAAKGPPVGPDPGRERPAACLGDGDGTLPRPWLDSLARHLESALGLPVAINDPFGGGHIIRAHASELPWVQLELSRAPTHSHPEKSRCVLEALAAWCRDIR